MKDAKGHGSDPHGGAAAHQEGVEKQVPRRFTTLAGSVTVGTKDPTQMTNSELQKEHENLTLHGSAVTREFINAGRGMEKPTDWPKTPGVDPLVDKDRAIKARASALRDEAHYRNTMGGRRVESPDGRVKFVGKTPGSLKHGYFP
jgi:hypothetical protein